MDVLIDPIKAMLRARFSVPAVPYIEAYGGEFSGDEVGRVAFACPAILIVSAGWTMHQRSAFVVRRAGFRAARMTAFVVAKDGNREDRMRSAARLSDRVTMALEAWVGTHTDTYTLAPPEPDSIRAENLYSAKIDKAGLALWAVSWTQCVQAKRQLTPDQLWELTAIDITDTMRTAAVSPPPPPPVPPLVVTEEITFTGA